MQFIDYVRGGGDAVCLCIRGSVWSGVWCDVLRTLSGLTRVKIKYKVRVELYPCSTRTGYTFFSTFQCVPIGSIG